MPKSPYYTKVESFYERERRMPTYSEMTKLFGFQSKNAVFKIVEKMVGAGVVAKDHLGRLVPTQSFNEVPMLGLVTAGLPATVDEEMTDTVKYFRNPPSGGGRKSWLEPANKNYQPIYPEHSLNVIAVLKAVIRKY